MEVQDVGNERTVGKMGKGKIGFNEREVEVIQSWESGDLMDKCPLWAKWERGNEVI